MVACGGPAGLPELTPRLGPIMPAPLAQPKICTALSPTSMVAQRNFELGVGGEDGGGEGFGVFATCLRELLPPRGLRR